VHEVHHAIASGDADGRGDYREGNYYWHAPRAAELVLNNTVLPSGVRSTINATVTTVTGNHTEVHCTVGVTVTVAGDGLVDGKAAGVLTALHPTTQFTYTPNSSGPLSLSIEGRGHWVTMHLARHEVEAPSTVTEVPWGDTRERTTRLVGLNRRSGAVGEVQFKYNGTWVTMCLEQRHFDAWSAVTVCSDAGYHEWGVWTPIPVVYYGVSGPGRSPSVEPYVNFGAQSDFLPTSSWGSSMWMAANDTNCQ
jgi:hypothetical protein